MYLSVRLPDFEYASDIKYGKWSKSEVNNIPAIELLEYLVILHKKISINVAL